MWKRFWNAIEGLWAHRRDAMDAVTDGLEGLAVTKEAKDVAVLYAQYYKQVHVDGKPLTDKQFWKGQGEISQFAVRSQKALEELRAG